MNLQCISTNFISLTIIKDNHWTMYIRNWYSFLNSFIVMIMGCLSELKKSTCALVYNCFIRIGGSLHLEARIVAQSWINVHTFPFSYPCSHLSIFLSMFTPFHFPVHVHTYGSYVAININLLHMHSYIHYLPNMCTTYIFCMWLAI